jgi:hypothetical protein
MSGIERFGCQLYWLRRDGQSGYWHANKDNLPFAQEFAVLSHIESNWVQPLSDCGLFIKYFNGNRVDACWDVNCCRKCNWNGRIQPKQRSYSPDAWLRGGHWYGYTISYETDLARARAIGRLISEEDYPQDNPASIIYREKF